MPTPAQIKAELDADPLNLGYAALVAAGNDTAVAALLNIKAYRGPVPIRELGSLLLLSGVTGGIKVALANPSLPDQLRGVCETAITLLVDDFRLETADVDDPLFGSCCDALIAASIMTSDTKMAALALADNRRSRAEVLWGDGVSVSSYDVGRARRVG